MNSAESVQPELGHPSFASGTSEALNRDCFCTTLDISALADALDSELSTMGLPQEKRQHLVNAMFARQPVFVANDYLNRMAKIVAAVEVVTALPAYRQSVFEQAPLTARYDDGTHGVFFGYDFHLHHGNLGLIEINTNAGGALLNAALARAQRACCSEVEAQTYGEHTAENLENSIVTMFREEWRLAKASLMSAGSPLTRIAIVDDKPIEQALYPEFLLLQSLLRRNGIDTIIADRTDLQFTGGKLLVDGQGIDLVYNRLTDFYFQEENSGSLMEAWLNKSVAVTPNPHHYALYADKRNLVRLSDRAFLQSIGTPAETIQTLSTAIPKTVLVSPANAEQLWRERKHWFFKPATGFGSRAAYRGDKVTKRVWGDILTASVDGVHYIAQKIIQPGQRLSVVSPDVGLIKFDLRNYVYQGQVQWTAARLYQGQTTNFRTPGGGFAPVYGLEETNRI
jgi:hypothetical protein